VAELESKAASGSGAAKKKLAKLAKKWIPKFFHMSSIEPTLEKVRIQ
jgi:hypothetical protein